MEISKELLAEIRKALVTYGCRHPVVCANEACRAAGHEHENYGEDGWCCEHEECGCAPACEGHAPKCCPDAYWRGDLVEKIDALMSAPSPSPTGPKGES